VETNIFISILNAYIVNIKAVYVVRINTSLNRQPAVRYTSRVVSVETNIFISILNAYIVNIKAIYVVSIKQFKLYQKLAVTCML